MKYLSMLALLLLFVGTPAHSQEDVFSGRYVLEKCNEGERFLNGTTAPDLAAASVCVGYVRGVLDGMQIMQYMEQGTGTASIGPRKFICVPPGSTNEQYMRIALKYLRDHPENLHVKAGILLATAFSQAFPCSDPE